MNTVQEALAQILGDTLPLSSRTIELERACGYVTASNATASLDLPPFANSAVDGFSVRLKDFASPGPVTLPELGEARAGDPPTSFPSDAGCVRTMTGAPVPVGADAVVMKEDVVVRPGGLVQFSGAPSPGDNIRPKGQDIRSGEVAVPAGARIRPSEIALLAALGLRVIDVVARPRIAIFTTGDEVVMPGSAIEPGQIYNSNSYMLRSLVTGAGFELGTVAHLADDLDATRAALQQAAADHHAIISTGGVSVGDYDFVRLAIEQLGSIHFWRVAMKPGKPLVYARIGDCSVFGLPGNPVSSMVSFELFVRPALMKMAGNKRLLAPRVRARLLEAVSHRPGREEYVRVMTTRLGDEFVANPSPVQGSHMITSMVAANSLAVIPAEAGSMAAGSRVDVIMTEWPED